MQNGECQQLTTEPGSVNRIAGYEPSPNPFVKLAYNIVAPDYFHTSGMPLLRGRDFVPQDSARTPRVVIVNDAQARQF